MPTGTYFVVLKLKDFAELWIPTLPEITAAYVSVFLLWT